MRQIKSSNPTQKENKTNESREGSRRSQTRKLRKIRLESLYGEVTETGVQRAYNSLHRTTN